MAATDGRPTSRASVQTRPGQRPAQSDAGYIPGGGVRLYRAMTSGSQSGCANGSW